MRDIYIYIYNKTRTREKSWETFELTLSEGCCFFFFLFCWEILDGRQSRRFRMEGGWVEGESLGGFQRGFGGFFPSSGSFRLSNQFLGALLPLVPPRLVFALFLSCITFHPSPCGIRPPCTPPVNRNCTLVLAGLQPLVSDLCSSLIPRVNG